MWDDAGIDRQREISERSNGRKAGKGKPRYFYRQVEEVGMYIIGACGG